MAKTITVTLTDDGVAAYAALQRAGIRPDKYIESALVDEANRLRGKAARAADVLEHARQQVGVEDARDIPHQIEYVRPPR